MKEPSCVHHFKINAPDGTERLLSVEGVCKKCGEQRMFPTVEKELRGSDAWTATGIAKKRKKKEKPSTWRETDLTW